MKNAFTYCLLSALLLTAAGCKKEDADRLSLTQSCDPTAQTIKAITNAVGVVSFNQTLQQYVISVHQPGTIDSVDNGVVCGSLPASLQADGTLVYVSGTFRKYSQAPPAPTPAGTTYYYLEVSSIQAK